MSSLPTIKCSSCAVDIDILHLADHVCKTAPAPGEYTVRLRHSPPSTISPKFTRAATFQGPTFISRSNQPAPSGRMPPPPRIDANAANKPFRPLDPSPINNYNHAPARSPGPAPPVNSPFKMTRSVTTPAAHSKAPPSPDYNANLDSAFPPFRSTTVTPKSARFQPRERLEPHPDYAQPSPLFAPLSPRFDGGENIARRINTIAPGPFDGKTDSRPSRTSTSRLAADAPAPGHQRNRTQGSVASIASLSQQRSSVTSNTSRTSANSNRSLGLPSHPKLGVQPRPPRPLTPDPTEGIDAFLDRLQRESSQTARSTKENTATEPLRKNSKGREPPPRPRRPSEKDLPPADMIDLDAPDLMPPPGLFPSRGSSRSGSESDVPRGLAPSRSLRPPPLAASALGDGQSTGLHTPSDSGFSDDSYGSSGVRSIASSRSSPPESEAAHSRQASKISRPDYAADETIRTSASPEPYAEDGRARAPRTYMRPDGAEPYPPRSLSPNPRQPTFPPSPYVNHPESPMDPAIQMGARTPMSARGPMSRNATQASRSPPRNMAEPEPQQLDGRQPKAASKGNCRGCSEPIIGKSVKDSSGRLTGRYHKHCFVCRECAVPFPTAEFYVFENAPYCEQHYHKLNGSLCNACRRGIEGQYLETDMRQKFHPRCFACSTCRLILRDGYFEVAGRRYCERHAQAAAAPPRNHLGPGNYRPRNLQKRGTRLMMMA
ncbi:uncharacterized protein SETTUDRAFT_135788 [Exserohilum turcica Et28A]|uniref:LIM zinc-binding domain-containing protein n=1 Tax=Exserohilum turcicum (strain 28A) TaxID=671987 RepID=R0K220_EXST2|nr:uncharacterized protein SETTUDRAFT_135788 [Exserohilum turcica Et28A]EOA87183.1 hypothetical protein SETTUDRAFT_135788 [Exserohilum turcica Et28A]